MNPTIALYVIFVMFAGGFVGWHMRGARGAHAEVKLMKGRIPASRKARTRSVLVALATVAITLLALRALLKL